MAFAALLLLALAAPYGVGSLGAAWRRPSVWVAGVAQASFNVTFFSAVTTTGVAVGTLVAIGCTPILTGLAARQMSRAWLTATGLALVGLAALLSEGLAAGVSVAGVAFALGASASYATFIMASSAKGTADMDMQPKLAAIFVVAAGCLSPALVLSSLGWVTTGSGAAMLAYLTVAATVLAYSLFNRGLSTVSPGNAATLALVEPLIAALLGVAVVGERLSVVSWVGAAILLGALLVMVRMSAPRDASPESEGVVHNRQSDL
jgi:DME family drug/metabolite transporter